MTPIEGAYISNIANVAEATAAIIKTSSGFIFFLGKTNAAIATINPSHTYLKNLFSYIVDDLSGITFSQVDFEWGLLATDLNHEVRALNSPLNFTIIDTTFNNIDNSIFQIGSGTQNMEFNFLNELLGAK